MHYFYLANKNGVYNRTKYYVVKMKDVKSEISLIVQKLEEELEKHFPDEEYLRDLRAKLKSLQKQEKPMIACICHDISGKKNNEL